MKPFLIWCVANVLALVVVGLIAYIGYPWLAFFAGTGWGFISFFALIIVGDEIDA